MTEPSHPPDAELKAIETWALGEAHRGPRSGRPELGLLLMTPGGGAPTQLTDCDIKIQDLLPTGIRPDEHFFIIDGHLHVGVAQRGQTPVRVQTTPANLTLSALVAVSRSRVPTILHATVERGQTTTLWEFAIHDQHARGVEARPRSEYRSFEKFQRAFHVVRCNDRGEHCIVTRRQSSGAISVQKTVQGPLDSREPMFDLPDCQRAVRGWWSPTDPTHVYLVAACSQLCAKPSP